MSESIKQRIKNPWFWVGLVGVIGTAMQISPETLTSWQALGKAVKDLFSNPYMLGCVFCAVLGVFVAPNTPGLTDKTKGNIETKKTK